MPLREAPAVAAGRVAFIGAVFGLETAIVLAPTGFPIAAAWILGGAAYAAVAWLAAAGARRLVPDVSLLDRLGATNAIAGPLTLAGLAAVSAATQVSISSTGDAKHYRWFPLWLAAPAALALLVWVSRRLYAAAPVGALRAVERSVVVFVVAPVFLFLLLSSLPGAAGRVDTFHEGEALAAGNLTAHGAFPWRDLLFIHGLLQDVFPPLLGRAVFGDSRWGWIAALSVIVFPLYWVALYILCAYLFQRDWLFLAATQAVVVTAAVGGPMIRFLLFPLVFVLLGLMLTRPSWPRAAGFMALLIAQVILAPEAALGAAACIAIVVVFDLYYFQRGQSLLAGFRRTVLCGIAGLILIVLWCAVLGAVGALGDFIGVYATFSAHHELTGGLPVMAIGPNYWFAAFAPVVLIVLFFWYLVAKTRLRANVTPQEWVIAAVTLFSLLYYHKYLARADQHVWESFAVAVPVLFFAVYRIAAALDGWPFARWIKTEWWIRPRHVGVIGAACLALTVLSPTSLFKVIGDAGTNFEASVARAEGGTRLGFAEPGALDPTLVPALHRVVARELGPNDRLFDFTNNPALFYYFLDLPSPTRYYHVSMAIKQRTQADLVGELDAVRPKLVVFTGLENYGIPTWDGISNQVRSYNVSDYILRHYRPAAYTHGFLFMRRAAGGYRSAPPHSRAKYFLAPQCDWGEAPNFLSTRPRPGAATVSIPFSRAGRAFVAGWAVDASRKRPAPAVVAAIGERVVARAVPRDARADVAASLHSPQALRSGFTLNLSAAIRHRGFDVRALRIYALVGQGQAVELGYLAGAGWAPTQPPVASLRLGEGRRAQVVVAPVPGAVEWSKNLTGPILRLHIPPNARGTGYNWLEVEAKTRFATGSFVLGDDTIAAARTIKFDTLEEGRRRLFVQVGACSQWYGMPLQRVFLRSTRPQDIAAIRLLR